MPQAQGRQAEGSGDGLDWQDKLLWFLEIPSPNLKFLGPQQRKIRTGWEDLPLSTLVFGGPRGEDLKHLQGLTLETVRGYSIRAVEAFFSDGRPPVRIGRRLPYESPKKHHWEVDGPGGKRITSIDSMWTNQDDYFGGLRVSSPHTGYRAYLTTR